MTLVYNCTFFSNIVIWFKKNCKNAINQTYETYKNIAWLESSKSYFQISYTKFEADSLEHLLNKIFLKVLYQIHATNLENNPADRFKKI